MCWHGAARRRDRKGRLQRAPYLPTRTCPASGKYCFPDKRAVRCALRRAADARRRTAVQLGDAGLSSRREVRAYKCPHCRAWHLTSRPPR